MRCPVCNAELPYTGPDSMPVTRIWDPDAVAMRCYRLCRRCQAELASRFEGVAECGLSGFDPRRAEAVLESRGAGA